MKSGRAVGRRSAPADPSHATLLWRADTDRNIVALTFDDGPDPRYTPGILAALADHDAVATFFMQGNHVEAHPDLARQVGERHRVGNHSYSHPNLGTASADEARQELGQAHEIILRLLGEPPVAFRPPYGSMSGATGMVAADMGYDIILWSDRISSQRTVEANHRRLARDVRPGAIVLGHDGGDLPNQVVVDSLPGVLELLAEQDVELVTIPDLLAADRGGSGDENPDADPAPVVAAGS